MPYNSSHFSIIIIYNLDQRTHYDVKIKYLWLPAEEPGPGDADSATAEEKKDPDLPVIALLAKMGASVNERDKYGLTPLHHAAMRGNVKEVEQLVDCGGIDIEVSEKSLCNTLQSESA